MEGWQPSQIKMQYLALMTGRKNVIYLDIRTPTVIKDTACGKLYNESYFTLLNKSLLRSTASVLRYNY